MTYKGIILGFIIWMLLFVGVMYGIGFIQLEYDPFKWSEAERFLLVWMGGLVGGMVAFLISSLILEK